MNDSARTRAPVDRDARRNYVIFCTTATLVMAALVAVAIAFVNA